MYPRLMLKTAAFFVMLLFVFAGNAFCQNDFEQQLKKKVDSLLAPEKEEAGEGTLVPDDALQTMTVPSGWGGYGTYLFGDIGGVYPQVYQTKADLIASGGISFGDPFNSVNTALSINMTDVHRFQDFSGNFVLSRVVSTGTSISFGGLELLANKRQSDAPGQTFFIAFGHSVQSLPSLTPGSSKLTYTIGIGTGRFYLKSPDDIAAGRGKNGTAIFANVSYEVFHHVNLIAEWSGTNLCVATGVRPFREPFSLGIGAFDLTRYSGDKPGIIFSVGYPLSLNRKKS